MYQISKITKMKIHAKSANEDESTKRLG